MLKEFLRNGDTEQRGMEVSHPETAQVMKEFTGSPVLGGSFSGNVAAADVAARGLLNGLTSDYVSASMLHGAFLLHHEQDVPLPTAIGMVSSEPARLVMFADRGRIECGLKANLVRVRLIDSAPRVMACVARATARCLKDQPPTEPAAPLP